MPGKPSWKARNNPPKGHNKGRNLFYCRLTQYRICRIILSRIESTEKVGFYSNIFLVVVDNFSNTHICCNDWMFIWKNRADNYKQLCHNLVERNYIHKGL